MTVRPRSLALLAAAGAALPVLGGCATHLFRPTQLWPRPMAVAEDPLPRGIDADTPPGLVEVVVFRHADPVQVRRPESPTAFPLTYYRKKQRMQSGAWVHVGAGGRGEVFFPADGAKLVLIDDSVCRIGEPSRGEADIRLEVLTRAEIDLSPGAVVQLPGGSLLSGPPDGKTGPYLVQHFYEELIRVFNQSKAPAYLAFRDERIELAAGERIDLPLLEAGGEPIDLGGPPTEWTGAGLTARAYGVVEPIEESAGLALRATSPGVVLAQGVAVRLRPGDEVAFLGLGPPPASSPTTAAAPPTEPSPEPPSAPPSDLEPPGDSGDSGDPGGSP
jgi:hypothetical protein